MKMDKEGYQQSVKH